MYIWSTLSADAYVRWTKDGECTLNHVQLIVDIVIFGKFLFPYNRLICVCLCAVLSILNLLKNPFKPPFFVASIPPKKHHPKFGCLIPEYAHFCWATNCSFHFRLFRSNRTLIKKKFSTILIFSWEFHWFLNYLKQFWFQNDL